jgi:hypothetical protein
MEGVCEDVKERIKERTGKGRDYKNRSFAPYSESYKKRKGKSRVNLRDSGRMLRALDTQVITPIRGKVFVKPESYGGGKRARTDMIAQIHTTGAGKQPQRDFMDITKTALKKFVKKHYDDKIMKILGRR